jgi:hypothetical protein
MIRRHGRLALALWQNRGDQGDPLLRTVGFGATGPGQSPSSRQTSEVDPQTLRHTHIYNARGKCLSRSKIKEVHGTASVVAVAAEITAHSRI